MRIPITGPRGLVIGYVHGNTYETVRRKEKGQIFMKKQFFDGKFINVGVAVDKALMNRLSAGKVEKVEFTIIGVERYSFRCWISISDILSKGVTIKYDKRNAQGQNYTGFSEQVVVDLDWCHRIDTQQSKLI